MSGQKFLTNLTNRFNPKGKPSVRTATGLTVDQNHDAIQFAARQAAHRNICPTVFGLNGTSAIDTISSTFALTIAEVLQIYNAHSALNVPQSFAPMRTVASASGTAALATSLLPGSSGNAYSLERSPGLVALHVTITTGTLTAAGSTTVRIAYTTPGLSTTQYDRAVEIRPGIHANGATAALILTSVRPFAFSPQSNNGFMAVTEQSTVYPDPYFMRMDPLTPSIVAMTITGAQPGAMIEVIPLFANPTHFRALEDFVATALVNNGTIPPFILPN